jgi:quercetin dioxygenase-like cupin family protein
MRRLAVLTSVLVLGAAAWVGGAAQSAPQAPAVAPGQPAPINPANFVGQVTPHATTDIRTLRYEFARAARTNWHSHAGGQVVFVERGRMRTQERGKAVQEFGPGAVVRTEPDVVHWHGALPGDTLTQVALSFGVTNWQHPVSDAEYLAR